MWSARLRRQAHQRRAQRRAAPPPSSRRGPVDVEAWRPVTARGVQFAAAATDDELRAFWVDYADGAWRPKTLDWIETALAAAGPHPLFIDVGAWIGPLTLFAAARGAKTLALEPDPAAGALLRLTLDANPELAERVRLISAALDGRPERLVMTPRSTGLGGGRGVVVASTLSADDLIERARRFGSRSGAVVRIDIEGHEFRIAPEIARLVRLLGAAALISTHPAAAGDRSVALAAVRALIAALRAEGLNPAPLQRPEAEATDYAAGAILRADVPPDDLDLTIEARPAPELIYD